LQHHYTTSLSTIEITSQNASKVQKEFRKYFNDAVSASAGEFRSVVVKTDGGDKLERLKKLLDRNSIDWSYANAATLNGLNYTTGKTESFKADAQDIVINMNQPKSNLVRVLFERNSKLSDSATYDITAWSMPYAYGVQAYGLNAYNNNTNKQSVTPAPLNVQPAYAYTVRWNGLQSAKFLGQILQERIKARYAEQPFTAKGQSFEKGSLIITRAANMQVNDFHNKVVNAARNAGVELVGIESGFVDKGFDLGSDRVRMINKPKVVLLTGSGVGSNAAGEIWHFFEQQLEYPITLVNQDEMSRLNWSEVDVVIMPDGFYRFLNDKAANDQLRNWVQQGGRLIALENAVAQLSRADWGLKARTEEKKDERKDEKKDDYTLLRRYENRERDYLAGSIPGSIYKVQLDNSHPLAFGYGDVYYTLKQDDNIYDYIKEGGWNVGVLKKDNYVSGFAGVKAKEKLKDGLLFGVQDLGRGNVVYLADDVLFRSFWENGKLMLCNAVFLVGQ
jgi:hypothetical protein